MAKPQEVPQAVQLDEAWNEAFLHSTRVFFERQRPDIARATFGHLALAAILDSSRSDMKKESEACVLQKDEQKKRIQELEEQIHKKETQ